MTATKTAAQAAREEVDGVKLPGNNGESVRIITQAQNEEISAIHDIIAGGIAGSASVIVGHPFDTIKVRLQTSKPGAVHGLGVASSFGGITSLFRGIGPPLSSAAVVNAIIFSSYAASSRMWDDYFHKPHNDSIHGVISLEGGILIDHAPKETHKEVTKNFVCGSFAGLINSFILCPVEHVKCRLQVQHGRGAADHVYNNSFSAARSIIKSHGMRGIYRGMVTTCCREVPGFGIYFCSYDLVRDRVSDGLGYGANTFVPSFISGGVAGSLFWLCFYPFDVVKSRVQTMPFDSPPKSLRTASIIRGIVRQHGWKSLYRGLGITLIRAFPVNAVTFPIYEFVLEQLRRNDA